MMASQLLGRCSLFLMVAVCLESAWMVVGFSSNSFVTKLHRDQHHVRTQRVWQASASAAAAATTTTTTSTVDSSSEEKRNGLSKRPSEDGDDVTRTPVKKQYDALITGAGPAGLLTAIMLCQKYAGNKNYKLALCEKRSSIPPRPTDMEAWSDVARFYLLGIGFRGQKALTKFGVYDDFEQASVPVYGRRDWQPGMGHTNGTVTLSNKSITSRILPRDKLVGVLHHHFMDHYVANNPNIDVLYGYQVDLLMDDDDQSTTTDHVQLQIYKCQEPTIASPVTNNNNNSDDNESSGGSTYVASQDVAEELCDVDTARIVTSSLVIGADGSARTIANAMEEQDKKIQKAIRNPFRRLLYQPFKVTRYEDDNPRYFKSVPIQIPKDWPQNLNYSARSVNSRITLEALPSDDDGNLCALLLMKPDDELCQPNGDTAKLRTFFEEEFPQFSALVSDDVMEAVANKPPSTLPAFRYSGPKLYVGDRTMILGDAAHTVKPYFGLGANSAMEDVVILSDCLNETQDDIPKAVKLFSDKRASDSEALVTMSRNMDRPGKLFFITFLAPLILDGIFHKALPNIFGPNMFQMFQRQDIGFTQIRKKKRLDRLMQISFILAFLSGLTKSTIGAIGLLSKVTGKSQGLITGTGVTLLAMATLLKKIVSKNQKSNEKDTPSATA